MNYRQLILTIDKESCDTKKLQGSYQDRITLFKNIPIMRISCNESEASSLSSEKGVLFIFDPLSPESHIEPVDPNLSYTQFYLNVLYSIDEMIDALNKGTVDVDVANIIHFPPKPYSYYELEPMNVATREASKKGLIIVAAAGDLGNITDKITISPWSVAPWVFGVGGADEGGKRIWKNSSTGKEGSLTYRPWIVAPVGIAAPTTSESAEKIHGTDVGYIIMADPEQKNGSRPELSTSTATLHISTIISYILGIITDLKHMLYCWPVFNKWDKIPEVAKLLRELELSRYTLAYDWSKFDNQKFNEVAKKIYLDLELKYDVVDESAFIHHFSALNKLKFADYFFEGQDPIKNLEQIGGNEFVFTNAYLHTLVENAKSNPYIPTGCFTYITEIMKHLSIVSRISPNFADPNEIPKIVQINQVLLTMLSKGYSIPYDISVDRMKELLADMARKIPDCPEYIQGHGYVDEDIFLDYFSSFEISKFSKMLIKDPNAFESFADGLENSVIFDRNYVLSQIADKEKTIKYASLYRQIPE